MTGRIHAAEQCVHVGQEHPCGLPIPFVIYPEIAAPEFVLLVTRRSGIQPKHPDYREPDRRMVCRDGSRRPGEAVGRVERVGNVTVRSRGDQMLREIVAEGNREWPPAIDSPR